MPAVTVKLTDRQNIAFKLLTNDKKLAVCYGGA